ncbi:hypothetical protein [Rhizocola hellebori]|uniref:hypothetical protein n=1 Tax=Rhizocola hellebori TaxID=1392758 RepID=UPI0019448141|nr:hypothetical protein [Rhizocola hellebori]
MLRDALKALLPARSTLDGVVAELDAVLFVAASAATPPAARQRLLAWLPTVAAGGDSRVQAVIRLVSQIARFRLPQDRLQASVKRVRKLA